VATVQDRYNLVDRGSEDVLAYCAANTIGFIPWFPLAAGELTRPGGAVDRIAKAHGATAGQVALAWLLRRSPVILPIPGTLRLAHLEKVAACRSRLKKSPSSPPRPECSPTCGSGARRERAGCWRHSVAEIALCPHRSFSIRRAGCES